MTIAERTSVKDPTNVDWQYNLAIARARVGKALLARGDAVAAQAELRAAVAIIERFLDKDPSNAIVLFGLADIHENLGHALVKRRDVKGALVEYEAGLAIARALSTRDASNASWRELAEELAGRVAHLRHQAARSR